MTGPECSAGSRGDGAAFVAAGLGAHVAAWLVRSFSHPDKPLSTVALLVSPIHRDWQELADFFYYCEYALCARGQAGISRSSDDNITDAEPCYKRSAAVARDAVLGTCVLQRLEPIREVLESEESDVIPSFGA
jgi:hypothetical protein